MGMLFAAAALAAALVQPGAVVGERQLAAAAPRPQTLYQTTKGTIDAFAQDGGLIAWFAPSKTACNTVNVVSLTYGTQGQLPDESAGAPNVTCRWEVAPPVGLALAGNAALWTLREKGPAPFDYVLGAEATDRADRAERRFKEVAHTTKGPGLWLGGIAGSGSTLVYGIATVAYGDEVACLSGGAGGSCDLKIAGGGVYRVNPRPKPPTLIEGTAEVGAVAVAATDTSVAYVPAAAVNKLGAPVAAADQPIEVRDSRTGALISRANPQGTPIAIALSRTTLASLEQTPIGVALAWYDPASGKRLGSRSMPAETSPELTVGDDLIVFRVGRSIRAVGIASHKVLKLARAASTPIGLSLEGSRLAWGENVKGRGRIQTLSVKGRG
jgi:hypothetical protein